MRGAELHTPDMVRIEKQHGGYHSRPLSSRATLRRGAVRGRSIRISKRSGFTLLEMVLAILITSILLLSVVTSIVDSFRLQMEALRLSRATTLAEVKMTQLINNPDLDYTHNTGNFGNSGDYAGYTYEVTVKEEKLDLAHLAEDETTGEKPDLKSLQSQLPTAIQNADPAAHKVGQGEVSETGGRVDVMHIVVTIGYPNGGDRRGSYSVETYRNTRAKP